MQIQNIFPTGQYGDGGRVFMVKDGAAPWVTVATLSGSTWTLTAAGETLRDTVVAADAPVLIAGSLTQDFSAKSLTTGTVGNVGVAIKTYPLNPVFGAIYPTNVIPSNNNFGLLVSSNQTYLNGVVTCYIAIDGVDKITLNTSLLDIAVPVKLSSGYTVATLPAGAEGHCAYVTDALAPAFLAAVVGGGAVRCPVFRNSTVWVAA